jgi:hypothetical protein
MVENAPKLDQWLTLLCDSILQWLDDKRRLDIPEVSHPRVMCLAELTQDDMDLNSVCHMSLWFMNFKVIMCHIDLDICYHLIGTCVIFVSYHMSPSYIMALQFVASILHGYDIFSLLYQPYIINEVPNMFFHNLIFPCLNTTMYVYSGTLFLRSRLSYPSTNSSNNWEWSRNGSTISVTYGLQDFKDYPVLPLYVDQCLGIFPNSSFDLTVDGSSWHQGFDH